MILYIPFFIELPFIFKLWLKNIPDYAIIFCRLLLIKNLIEQLFIPLSSAIAKAGKYKSLSGLVFNITFFPLTVSFVLFKVGFPPYILYIVFIIYSILSSGIILYYTKINCHLSVREFMMNVVLRCLLSFAIVFLIALIPYVFIEIGFIRLLLVIFMSTSSYLIVVYKVGLLDNERLKIMGLGSVILKRLNLKKATT